MSHVSNATIVVGDCGFGRCDASAFDSCTGQATVEDDCIDEGAGLFLGETSFAEFRACYEESWREDSCCRGWFERFCEYEWNEGKRVDRV